MSLVSALLSINDDMRSEGVRGDWVREWPASAIRPRLKWHHAAVAVEDDRRCIPG